MSQIDVRRNYMDGDILLASDLDAFLDDIEAFLNVTKINDDNIQDGGITASSKLADATITTAKIGNSQVTVDKLASDSVTTVKILDANVTTAKIADANVTTAKILDANVTPAKLAVGAFNKAHQLTLGATYTVGSGNFAVPADVSTLIIECCGGGGTGQTGAADSGGAGAGGGASKVVTKIISVTPSASVPYVVGASDQATSFNGVVLSSAGRSPDLLGAGIDGGGSTDTGITGGRGATGYLTGVSGTAGSNTAVPSSGGAGGVGYGAGGGGGAAGSTFLAIPGAAGGAGAPGIMYIWY